MGAIRQMKKQGKATPIQIDIKQQIVNAYEKGFIQGAKLQREQDIESTVTLLEGLENIPGIGSKTAWKIQEHVMKQFTGAQS